MRRPRGPIWAAVGGAILLAISGCNGGMPPRRGAAVAASEPGLAMPGDPEQDLVASAPPPRSYGIVDRHPILSKPRDVYRAAGENKAVKVAGATIIGIPMGVVGELRQIVVGRPPERSSY